jgi:hypothetical protein
MSGFIRTQVKAGRTYYSLARNERISGKIVQTHVVSLVSAWLDGIAREAAWRNIIRECGLFGCFSAPRRQPR